MIAERPGYLRLARRRHGGGRVSADTELVITYGSRTTSESAVSSGGRTVSEAAYLHVRAAARAAGRICHGGFGAGLVRAP